MARRKRRQIDPEALGPEEIVVDTLFVLMRQCSTQGVHGKATEETAERLRTLIEQAEVPLALQFLGETAYRDHTLVPLHAEVFRRSQQLLQSLDNLSVREIVFEAVPSLEALLQLADVLVKGSHGPSDAMRRASLKQRMRVSIRPRAQKKDEDDTGERVHAATTRIALAATLADELPRHPEREWPWDVGIAVVRQVEAAVAANHHAAARTIEHMPGSWTISRRATCACLRIVAALTHLGVGAFVRRSASHALLALATHGYGERSGKPVPEAAERAIASLLFAPPQSPSGITAHRLRATTILHALARAAEGGKGEPPLLGLVRAVYEIERQRCPVELDFALTAVDLLARLAESYETTGDEWPRALLSAGGPVPAGAYVLADGRLGIAYEPAEDAWRPRVRAGTELIVPREPVELYSPVAMAPIRR